MFLIDLPEPWCDLLFLKSTRSRLMPHLEWKGDGEEESPISADWLWNALLRLVWFKFCLQMVALFDKVGIFTDYDLTRRNGMLRANFGIYCFLQYWHKSSASYLSRCKELLLQAQSSIYRVTSPFFPYHDGLSP